MKKIVFVACFLSMFFVAAKAESLPTVLSESDAEIYKQIFDLQSILKKADISPF